MFYLLEFDDINNKETQDLMFDLLGIPNGTITSYGTQIRLPSSVPKDKRLFWFDDTYVKKYAASFEMFSHKKGIKRFSPIENMQKTIYDKDWKWEDDYIMNIFLEYL